MCHYIMGICIKVINKKIRKCHYCRRYKLYAPVLPIPHLFITVGTVYTTDLWCACHTLIPHIFNTFDSVVFFYLFFILLPIMSSLCLYVNMHYFLISLFEINFVCIIYIENFLDKIKRTLILVVSFFLWHLHA